MSQSHNPKCIVSVAVLKSEEAATTHAAPIMTKSEDADHESAGGQANNLRGATCHVLQATENIVSCRDK